MSCWDKNKTKTQTSGAGSEAGEAVLPSPAGSDLADGPEQRDERSTPEGRMRHPPPLRRLPALPVGQRGTGEGASSLTGRACLSVCLCLLPWLLFLPPKGN